MKQLKRQIYGNKTLLFLNNSNLLVLHNEISDQQSAQERLGSDGEPFLLLEVT